MADREDPELAAILADPDADGPRRRLAQRWTAAGDPRGEFVATQLRLAELPSWHPERPALCTRERQLLAAHRDEWLAALPLGGLGVRFERGLVAAVEGRPAQLREALPRLARYAPITDVTLVVDEQDDGPDPDLFAWLDTPALGRIRALSLPDGDVLPDRWAELLASDGWQALERIELGESMCEPEVAEAMANTTMPATLRGLRCEGHMGGFGDAGGTAIARAPWLAQLDLLTLNGQSLSDPTLLALAASPARPRVLGLAAAGYGENTFSCDAVRSLRDAELFTRVESLNLIGAPIGEALPELLPRLHKLRRASLGRTGLDGDDVRLLVRELTFADWDSLSLSSNPIGDHGARMLGMCQRLPRVLDLSGCDVTAAGLRELAIAPAVDAIDLRTNPLPAATWRQQFDARRLPKATAMLCDARDWPPDLVADVRAHYPRADLVGAAP